jgi:hypothetical protein
MGDVVILVILHESFLLSASHCQNHAQDIFIKFRQMPFSLRKCGLGPTQRSLCLLLIDGKNLDDIGRIILRCFFAAPKQGVRFHIQREKRVQNRLAPERLEPGHHFFDLGFFPRCSECLHHHVSSLGGSGALLSLTIHCHAEAFADPEQLIGKLRAVL